MAAADSEISASAWAVLGVLSFPGERTGYEIKAWADRSVRFFYSSPALSQVYRELKRLEDAGYVVSRVEAGETERGKRLYRITDVGRDALTAWARRAPQSPPVLKHGVLLRVWLGHLLSVADLEQILQQHVEWAQGMVADAAKRERVAGETDSWRYPQLALRWSTRYFAAERDLAQALLADLHELAAGRRPGTAPGEWLDEHRTGQAGGAAPRP